MTKKLIRLSSCFLILFSTLNIFVIGQPPNYLDTTFSVDGKATEDFGGNTDIEIGRASCRERV